MFLKVSTRAVPGSLLVISTLWAALFVFPLLFFLFFPATDIQQLTAALKNQQAPPEGLEALQQQFLHTAGRLKQAIPVTAFYFGNIDYKPGDLRVSRKTEIGYLAWPDRRPGATLLIITRTKVGTSPAHIHVGEGRPISVVRLYSAPVIFFGLSLLLYCKRNTIWGHEAGRTAEPKTGSGSQLIV